MPEGELDTDPEPVTETVSVKPPTTGVTTTQGVMFWLSVPEVPVIVKFPEPGHAEAGDPEDAKTVSVEVAVEFEGGVTEDGEKE